MSQLTRQQIFDKAINQMRKQGYQKSTLPQDEYSCAYAGENNKACHVGACMTHEDAQECDSLVGGSSIRSVFNEKRKIYDKYFSKDDTSFLEELQRIHDCGVYRTYRTNVVAEYEAAMQEFAVDYNLIYTAP